MQDKFDLIKALSIDGKDWELASVTAASMDAGHERTGMYLPRVTEVNSQALPPRWD